MDNGLGVCVCVCRGTAFVCPGMYAAHLRRGACGSKCVRERERDPELTTTLTRTEADSSMCLCVGLRSKAAVDERRDWAARRECLRGGVQHRTRHEREGGPGGAGENNDRSLCNCVAFEGTG